MKWIGLLMLELLIKVFNWRDPPTPKQATMWEKKNHNPARLWNSPPNRVTLPTKRGLCYWLPIFASRKARGGQSSHQVFISRGWLSGVLRKDARPGVGREVQLVDDDGSPTVQQRRTALWSVWMTVLQMSEMPFIFHTGSYSEEWRQWMMTPITYLKMFMVSSCTHKSWYVACNAFTAFIMHT